MTRAEKLLTVHFLRQLADKMGNAGCNDLDDEVLNMLTPEEKVEFAAAYGPYNNEPDEEFEFDRMGDFMVVRLLAHKIEQEAS